VPASDCSERSWACRAAVRTPFRRLGMRPPLFEWLLSWVGKAKLMPSACREFFRALADPLADSHTGLRNHAPPVRVASVSIEVPLSCPSDWVEFRQGSRTPVGVFRSLFDEFAAQARHEPVLPLNFRALFPRRPSPPPNSLDSGPEQHCKYPAAPGLPDQLLETCAAGPTGLANYKKQLALVSPALFEMPST